MLESIHIENIALIKKLDISFSDAFSAFTGETGAGKSIIIDSICCLCGNKTPKELIRNGEDYAIVEGIFSGLGNHAINRCRDVGIEPDEDGMLYISRTIKADGKNTVRINGKVVPLSILKDISPSLINIHGQHDNTELLNKDSHRKLLDSYGELEEECEKYHSAYANYCSIKKQLDAISTDEGEKLRRIEMLKFQINDISALKLKDGEEEKLSEEKKKLINMEKISRNSSIVADALGGAGMGACDSIDRAVEALRSLARISDEYEEFVDSLAEIKSKLLDISETVADMAGYDVENPSIMLDRIEARLDEIQKAKRKYGSNIQQVLEYYEQAKNELDDLENFDKKSDMLRDELNKAGAILKSLGSTLSKARMTTAENLRENIEKQMQYLDMPGVKFKVNFADKPYGKDGADDVEFFVMTNSGEGFSPLSKTASGGELSRIMLAIKSVIAEKDGIDTLIFDEVDTGISGKTSRKIGLKLSEISNVSQVLCVTHSAQICSVADTHYRVSKYTEDGRTFTDVKPLDKRERIDETARIIAGIDITESAVEAAKELIENKML